ILVLCHFWLSPKVTKRPRNWNPPPPLAHAGSVQFPPPHVRGKFSGNFTPLASLPTDHSLPFNIHEA
ncbi:hypothetical protein, partial [Rhodonellum sp.]|uniref:hypothetical protein n=1 Tax=Rhodonellum sp. TaxID=2231180 RepID=UPI002717CA9F